ncbi:DNA topoisomerase III [Sphingobacterium multivorum]|uniref:DNA topoisomerase III n=2 Tax=Sphingobacterium multivorum TaxID=28454 RepID=A0A2X2JL66_SPHMU|nr:DNA topoisomerase III [Sphingobacterium multivorum]
MLLKRKMPEGRKYINPYLMKAIIAEKPSVAYELARIVGATEKRDGYFEAEGFL